MSSPARVPIRIGETEYGSDNHLYVAKTLKHWKKTVISKVDVNISNKNNVRIAIGEVASRIIYTDRFSVHILIPKSFILSNPKKIMEPFGGNAYVFGQEFTSGYQIAGNHGNDRAQTGILMLDGLTDDERNFIKCPDNWKNIYPDYDWDSEDSLHELQRICPHVLFIGQTVGGDVGADVLVHYDPEGLVDSIIIDNGIFC
jgi:hypothetical protein